jgi:hypothetical protein
VGAGAAADSPLVLSGENAIRREENRRANAVIFSSTLSLGGDKNEPSHPKNGSWKKT